MKRKVCFFAKVRDREQLRRVEFYGQDIRALEELGLDVELAVSPRELAPADLYVAWWWTWAFFPVTYARLRRRPVIVTGVFDFWDFPRRPFREKMLMLYALRAATTNVFVSKLEYEEIPLALKTASPRYIPCAVDSGVYRPGAAARENFILTVATMKFWNPHRKSIPEVIRAAPIIHEQFPDVRFIIAGEHEEKYPAMARDVGASEYVSFPGVISRDEKISLMQRCSVYLQPSRFEGFGLAIAEAMSCGAPLVTSPVGEIPNVVGDAAEFVDGESAESVAAGTIALLKNAERRRQLELSGPARVSQFFSFERHKEEWRRLLQEMGLCAES